MEYQGIKIEHLSHDTFCLSFSQTVVYIDPFKLAKDQPKADFILISHQHHDHCSPEDINQIVTENTVIIASKLCQEELSKLSVKPKDIIYTEPNQHFEFDQLKISTVPAYNLDKWRSEGVPYHPKEEKHVGFLAQIKDITVYHTGDTDNIPEMATLSGIDVVLLPVSGKYVMTWQEAVECCKIIKPKLAIPMHFGVIVGNKGDAEKFQQTADCPVEII